MKLLYAVQTVLTTVVMHIYIKKKYIFALQK